MNTSPNGRPRLRMFLGVAGVMLVLLLAFKLRGQAQAGDKEAMAAIDAVLKQQVEAWNAGKLEDFMAGYWQSDELTFYSGKTLTKGWNATLERYRKKYQGEGKEMGKLSFRDVSIEVLGKDSAFVRGRWKVEMKGKTLEGLFTLIFRKVKDGWRIVHDHTSTE
ncbi:MAG TPA: nuclear transport factor 2 family protein [Gemmataceae bacterium]|nr:nuclear transport factor 2 family protein [Gemmataceae bacterium]